MNTESAGWLNNVMRYGFTRGSELGLTNALRPSLRKRCPLCHQEFNEDSIPHPYLKRLGADHLDFCAPCLSQRFFRNRGRGDATKDDII